MTLELISSEYFMIRFDLICLSLRQSSHWKTNQLLKFAQQAHENSPGWLNEGMPSNAGQRAVQHFHRRN